MKAIGFALTTLAFLAGSIAAVWSKDAVVWIAYGPALALGILGVILLHQGHRRVHRSDEKMTAGLGQARMCLDRIVLALAQIEGQVSSRNAYDARTLIDEGVADDVAGFVEARQAIAHTHGLGAYAAVMSEFAAAERILNRAWSASADGYADEVQACLTQSLQRFRQTQQRLEALCQGASA